MRVDIVVAVLVGLCALWFNLKSFNDTLLILKQDSYNHGANTQYVLCKATIDMQAMEIDRLSKECRKWVNG